VETIASSNPNGVSVAYTYDPVSNVAAVKAPYRLTSNFTYDALNGIRTIKYTIDGGRGERIRILTS
jgi:YD repeat-containing protein